MAFASYTATHGRNAVLQRLNGVFDSLRERSARRKVFKTTRGELMALTDRDLADLGLARAEINRVAYQAAYGD
ncbi:DUF1127 domain-containing protein [Thalassococcus sp. BH17M4-6]|uniref:DUF1127 domain-containing protein n=1 Tax=Thalassococcus sp. BH17M4-6 TaxID=3413148 RepID=UPI003BD524D8